jgi:hypothetical protein
MKRCEVITLKDSKSAWNMGLVKYIAGEVLKNSIHPAGPSWSQNFNDVFTSGWWRQELIGARFSVPAWLGRRCAGGHSIGVIPKPAFGGILRASKQVVCSVMLNAFP